MLRIKQQEMDWSFESLDVRTFFVFMALLDEQSGGQL
jgi:hypothetical protein